MSRRPEWAELPRAVRDAVESFLGSRVVRARSQAGGFSPGFALRLGLADGRRAFAKGIDRAVNEYTHGLHRREIAVMRQLDASIGEHGLPVPRLRGDVEVAGWMTAVFDDVAGRLPRVPWRRREFDQACAAVARVHRHLGPGAEVIVPLAVRDTEVFRGWRRLVEVGDVRGLSPWVRANLDRLADLESRWADGLDGDAVLHSDLRADNFLLTTDGARIVDWAHACTGPPWADLVLMAPSVAAAGGPDGEEIVERACGVRPAAHQVTALLCAAAGYFVENARKPAPPGMPLARESQRRQGRYALSWLRRRLTA